MEKLQIDIERAVGDQFIQWLNKHDNVNYVFLCRGDDAPDLVYQIGRERLGVEVVGAYYNKSHAIFQWQDARQLPDAPDRFDATNFDIDLKDNICKRIAEKCLKNYGSNCILLVTVNGPFFTPMADFQEMLPSIRLPNTIPFSAIYVAGNFPASIRSPGGYFVWEIFRQGAYAITTR